MPWGRELPSAPGDFGRRVAHRRAELGLSRAQVASRAELAVSYLEHLEEHPANVSPGAMLRLADALETTASDLLGADVEMPPGRRSPVGRSPLEPMADAECRRLLGRGGVGRVVFVDDRGPVALPVNFRMVDGDIVFRTEALTTIAAVAGDPAVSFEVDRIDDAMAAGWSILATGTARRVDDPAELSKFAGVGIEPWADGERDVLLRLTPRVISGRRIRSTR
jgi:nitroimidazol reductase NimA-like FMN-containing flavoprotein (pyridoxamine 5'-phosphate oxidase superfamily)